MVRTLVPFDVTICGIPELDQFRDARVSHVLSIIDPQEPEPDSFRFYPSHERLTLRFDDVVGAYPGFQAPGRDDVKKLLDFGQSLQSSGKDGHLLVHCHAGISRSTAATAILLAQHNPGREREAFLALLDMRPHAWPNTRMVDYADELLERKGKMLMALGEYRRALLERKPHLAEIIRNIGRGNELPK